MPAIVVAADKNLPSRKLLNGVADLFLIADSDVA
jgi:hypothetical protein